MQDVPRFFLGFIYLLLSDIQEDFSLVPIFFLCPGYLFHYYSVYGDRKEEAEQIGNSLRGGDSISAGQPCQRK